MDILQVIRNHLDDQIIRYQSFDAIARHEISQPRSICIDTVPESLHVSYTDIDGYQHRYRCKNPACWMRLSPYIYDMVCDFAMDTVEIPIITDKESLSLLDSFISSLDIPATFSPVDLFCMKIKKHIPHAYHNWFHKAMHADGVLSYERLSQLLDVAKIADFIGCDVYMVYLFMFVFAITISISCTDRETYLHHKYFMLPVEGWDHPLKSIYQIPFICESQLVGCIDNMHLIFKDMRQI